MKHIIPTALYSLFRTSVGGGICIFMLFLSFNANAANHHKIGKKAPLAAHVIIKSNTKRKRVSLNNASKAYQQSDEQQEILAGINPFRQKNINKLQITEGMHPQISTVQKNTMMTAEREVIANLRKQLGKPYHYGGTSPSTGFDCSGLINYAYRDHLKSTLPRTANNMFHMSAEQAIEIEKEQLHSGDLVFFRTHSRGYGYADHVGVYLGGGEFIQAPRTGKDIQISRLDEDYWQEHYIGARRVLLPSAVR
ncbi:C40 family peptidase [Limnobaculum parvum]|uniref:Hydrolase n=1 Tax=Limnobaculum parvum TaxID=2172103 RepID=A0A2Y9TXI6_9GAMM|nr:C40 family peptidase [Limnobaculum parvum]AWH88261.1 hydrolase [Limnobaculum parvum]